MKTSMIALVMLAASLAACDTVNFEIKHFSGYNVVAGRDA